MLENYVLRPVLTFLLRLFFRVEVRGMKHYHAAGGRVLIIANHQSYLDPMLIATFLPEKPAFAINVFQAEKWYFGWIGKLFTLYRLDPSKPLSMKHLIQDLRKGLKLVIFPEGRITTSGGIMKIYSGTEMIIEKTGATVLPVRIDGAEYSKVSRMGGKVRQRWFPKIRMTILPPVTFPQHTPLPPHAIYDIMTRAAFDTSNYRRSILATALDAYAWHGGGHLIVDDMAHTPVGYRTLFTKAFILSGKLRRHCEPQAKQSSSAMSVAQNTAPIEFSLDYHVANAPRNDDNKYIGLMLPSSTAAMVTFLSLHMLGKIPCMLNFSAGEANILHACRIASVKTVLTSRAFIEKAKLEALITALQKECRVVFLEDIRHTITLADKLAGLGKALFARAALQKIIASIKPDDPAVILYTSGSEGTPKGVALSHANLLANIAQAISRLDLTPHDILFNAMPVFHSFGLTIGMILPLVQGIKTFMYPSPLHYRVIPELVYDTDATVMLGTDTFYNGYAHYAHPYDFWNVRLAVAGAEKLKDTTRQLFSEKFRLNIVEGYGVTEASPVIAVNTPMQHKPGSVGRVLPGIECRLDTVEGLSHGGRLHVRGPNVMLGYININPVGSVSDSTGSCAALRLTGLADGWYDTGDIVSMDEEGYIFIQGRAKRFAKIAGEMVSLLAVEELADSLFPESAHAAIACADERKGEHIVLFTESAGLTRETLGQYARKKGVADICLPKHIVRVEAIPRLGSGKIDYIALAKQNAHPA